MRAWFDAEFRAGGLPGHQRGGVVQPMGTIQNSPVSK